MATVNIADLFCGAGGTSTGAIEAIEALGHSAQLTAINHWDVAIATHGQNHPGSRHLCTSLDNINPKELFGEGELDVLWASPECTHHSVARGGKPINDQSRATAWCVVRWAEALRPKIILVENVPEFATWGALGANGRPLKSKKGATFLAWLGALESLGYRVDRKILCAADYGDPTTRRRLFVQAVRGRRRIVWPNATHAPANEIDADMFRSALRQWVPAREIIDWDLPGQSIYERKKPLSPKTIKRIMAGLEKFGLKPFVVPQHASNGPRDADDPAPTITTTSRGVGIAEPFLVAMEHGGHVRSIDRPINTITTAKGGAHALASPYIVRLQHNNDGASVDAPLGTVLANGKHFALAEPHLLPQHAGADSRPISHPAPTVATSGAIALVEPYLIEYYGNGQAKSIDSPVPAATCKSRFGLVRPTVVIDGERYLLDIRFRMLQPHELAAAQGFRKDYAFTGNKTQQVKQIGNAVPRRLARAIVAAVQSQHPDVSWITDPETKEKAA